jgi:hypothetical protein
MMQGSAMGRRTAAVSKIVSEWFKATVEAASQDDSTNY